MKKIKIALAASAFSAMLAMTSFAGWQKINGNYYLQDASGKNLTGWQKVDDKWYYLDNDGVLSVNTWLKIDSKTYYYMKSTGEMTVGWKKIDNDWYYFKDGVALINTWACINNKWYYFNDKAKMVTGWLENNGSYYCMSNDGDMLTGWLTDGESYYFADPDTGKLCFGLRNIDGDSYLFDEYGKRYSGWYNTDTSHYFYFANGSGKMLKNCTEVIDGKTYSFDSSGFYIGTGENVIAGSSTPGASPTNVGNINSILNGEKAVSKEYILTTFSVQQNTSGPPLSQGTIATSPGAPVTGIANSNTSTVVNSGIQPGQINGPG